MRNRAPEGERGKSTSVASLRRILPFISPYKWIVAAAGVALVVSASSVLAIGQAIRRVIDHGFGQEQGLIDQYFLALLGVVCILAAATFARYFLVTWLGERIIADIRKAVYSHVIGLSPAFFETTRTGEVLSRLTADTTLIQTVVGSTASIALRNILMFVGGTVLLVISSPKLTGLVFALLPVVILPILVFGRKVRRLSRDSQDRIADITNYAEESLGAIQVVQAFCHEFLDRLRFGKITDDAFVVAILRTRARAWLTALVMLLIFGAIDAVVWIGANDVISGTMSGGQLAAFVFYAIIVAGSLGALAEVYGELQRAAGATERLVELLSVNSSIIVANAPEPLPSLGSCAISFKEVTFEYPSRPDLPALKRFNLEVASGETVALVGPSGAGKTTVFQLLLRFYDPQEGAVLLDEINLRHADPTEVRSKISLVPQDPVIFAANARENILYGRPDASEEQIAAAADAAKVSDFIESLPDKYLSFLGQKGILLSGGQRQRLSIARAILADPPVLLLDEATSSLDAESERAVQEALEGLMADRTTIVIAHRLATVLKADRIVVMEHGTVVEMGRHEDLVKQNGLYARFAALQFNTD
ncbi:MAG: putative multidrug export ATP-binding/permease protein [Alphaproteobacteria bacterium MarineAlpha1_Bin1]|nr:MAG: putative multidrug export ATP-binding/permease protein [Alphaproteobacteria bacterium MarineAlpha1_Bin1]